MKMQTILLGLLLAIISVAYTHPMPNADQDTESATNTKMVTDLQKMIEENGLSQGEEEVDTEDFRAENLAHESNMFEQTAALSEFDDQEANSDKLADESNRFQELAFSQEDDDQPEIAIDQDFNLADEDSVFQEEDVLSQVDDQTEIANDQDFNLENLVDKDSTFQEHAFSQVDDQTEIAGDQDFSPENDHADNNSNKQSDPSGEDDEPEIEGDKDFNVENLADKSNAFQQFAAFQVTDTDGNQNFKQESNADESDAFQERALSQMGDQQAEDSSDESDDLTADEMAIIQQEDLEDALEDEQKEVDSNTVIADDIIALLEGEDITKMESEHAEEQGISSTMFKKFNSGLRKFVNQMNTMISKYSNVENCFPRMQAEMERTDENDDELAKTVVDRLANIQGKQNREMRQLFQKIRQFIRTTSKKGRKLVRNIRRTFGSVLRGYEVVIKCVKRRRG